MQILKLVLFFALGFLMGIPLVQYNWTCLIKISEREEHCTFENKYPVLSAKSLMFSFFCGAAFDLFYVIKGLNITSVIYMLTALALISISLIDWMSYEIPPQFNVYIAALAVVNLVLNYKDFANYLIGSVLVSGIFLIILLILLCLGLYVRSQLKKVTAKKATAKGRAMGGGDIKLMFALGLLLGWQKILLVMFLGSLLGSVIHIIIMKITGDNNRVLSFGPYLAAGALIAMNFGDYLLGLYIKYCIPQI